MGQPFGGKKSPELSGILDNSQISHISDNAVSELIRKHEDSLKQVALLKDI